MGYRILCIGETWLGSDALAAFHAFRRLGHSIQIIDEWHFVPFPWASTSARLARKLLKPLMVRELAIEARRQFARFEPHLLFVFKGNSVSPDVLHACRERGVSAVMYYPDVSMMTHGAYLPKTIPLYDHIFTAKTFGLQDLASTFGMTQASFLAPGYDPEIHRPLVLTDEEKSRYGCDVSFIGTWSPKKEKTLSALSVARPDIRLKIWGCQWGRAVAPGLAGRIAGDEVTGDEYAKAIQGASICLGLLSERREGASSGDLITARTFQIPACETLMLHERNEEALEYFEEDRDAAFFGSPEELIERVDRYLADPDLRRRVARGGLDRSHRSGYSIDERMKTVIDWLEKRRD